MAFFKMGKSAQNRVQGMKRDNPGPVVLLCNAGKQRNGGRKKKTTDREREEVIFEEREEKTGGLV